MWRTNRQAEGDVWLQLTMCECSKAATRGTGVDLVASCDSSVQEKNDGGWAKARELLRC